MHDTLVCWLQIAFPISFNCDPYAQIAWAAGSQIWSIWRPFQSFNVLLTNVLHYLISFRTAFKMT
jgi:hypothetical protein